MNKWLPVGLLALWVTVLIGTTLYYGPSWGLMDDVQNLKLARDIWNAPNPLGELAANFMGGGVMRPYYFCWIAVAYAAFQNSPVGFYIFNFLGNTAAMLMWGVVFYKVFCVRRRDVYWTVFFYPLTFFIFTAFWNIFNYLSLQEKFIVFFAPLAIFLFQRFYRQPRWQDVVCLYAVVLIGLCSKATFIFVPAIMLAYAILDLVLFHYRPRQSWIMLAVNGLLFAAYAFFTLTFQLNQSYTEKYKSNLSAGAFVDRVIHLSAVMKVMLLIGAIGAVAVIVHCLRNKKPEFSLSILIYLGLMAYVVLLTPWGSQSYLLSATAPLVLGALFPVYDWVNRRGGTSRLTINVFLVVILALVFWGNIRPNISRMADIGKAMAFLRGYRTATAGEDQYFMPPPFAESAYAAGQWSGKNVIFCGNGTIARSALSLKGGQYILFNDSFPSITLDGVRIGEDVYSNPTWKVFKLEPDEGPSHYFSIPVEKNFVQQLKIKIRNIY